MHNSYKENHFEKNELQILLILSSTNEVIKIARNGIVYGKTWAIASAILKPLTIGTKPAKKTKNYKNCTDKDA